MAEPEERTLYEDCFVKVTDCKLVINRYYFPLATPREIAVERIEKFWQGNDPALGLNFFKKKTWGIALSDVFWAYKTFRETNDDKYNFVVKVQGDKLRSGFSVERPDEALTALRTATASRTD